MRRGVLSLAVVSSLALGGCVGGDWALNARATVSESRPLAKDGRFVLENTNGRVEITGWDEAKVSIEATKRAANKWELEKLQVEITGEGDSLSVRTRYPRPSLLGRVDYVVRVPRGVRVKAENVNGRVEIEGVVGEIGASTVNGSVEVNGAAGAVDASVVNGSVTVVLARVDPAGHSQLRTTNGSVRLTLPADANADVDAGTVNGGVRCDFDLADESRARRHLGGRIGAGGGHFELRAVNGSVDIDRGLAARSAAKQPAEAAASAAAR
jgi:Putative adhesin